MGNYKGSCMVNKVVFEEKLLNYILSKQWILSLETGEEDYTYRVSSSDSHPNTKGHKIFADHLYDRYKKIYGK